MARLKTPRAVSPVSALFWAQLGVGVLGGFGVVIGLWVVGQGGAWALMAASMLVAWLVGTVTVLLVLERRKPLSSALRNEEGWARHVRDLRASRLEVVTAFEIERRRIERDLHDGAQQQLVAAALKVGEAAMILAADPAQTSRSIAGLLAQAQDANEAALASLRATVAGIHPSVLSDLGLEQAVQDLCDRSALRVVVRAPHPLPNLPQGVAAAAYFLVAEALTNVAKHGAGASGTVLLAADDELHVSIVDDGPGGASLQPGHGLAGMTERLAAFGGALTLSSPPGGPTSLGARIPLLLAEGQPGVALFNSPGNEPSP